MKKYLVLSASILIIFSCILFSECKKTNSIDPPGSLKSPEVLNVNALNAMEALNFLMDTTFIANNGDNCPISTFFATADPNANVKFITTYNWSDNGCVGQDGKIRKGKIIVTYTGKINVPGNVAINTFSGFSSDGNRIEGFQEIKCKQPDPINNFRVFQLFSNLDFQFPNQNFSTYKSTLTRTLIQGSQTPMKDDDIWQVTGTFSGSTSEYINWTADCIKPLVKKGLFKWFVSGSIMVTSSNGSICTIDYGDGTLDNKATYKVGDKIVNIEM